MGKRTRSTILLALVALVIAAFAAGMTGGCSTNGGKDNPKVLPKKFPGGKPPGGG
jgi:hypothetical protein